MASALITVVVGALGLIVGWFVSGYQRVTEKLTEERRAGYLELLHQADLAHAQHESPREPLESAAEHARFICSDEMLRHDRIGKLVGAVDSSAWETERRIFFDLARYEGQRNSRWGRRLRRRDYARN